IRQEIGDEFEMNDGSEAALILFQRYKDKYYRLLQRCSYGRYLKSLNYEADLT
ncbi:MAG: hypothetical protein H8D42_03110, partial [Candidatus Marinimicrobia bacterium]|nr:hypothetical protein [Candidatus Neomarinimicrobiota bacterium]